MKKIILITLIALTNTFSANAATYNFTFNNTEQGDNSTATPSLTIKDGKDGKTEIISAKNSNNTNTQSEISVLEPPLKQTNWRLIVGAASVTSKNSNNTPQYATYSYARPQENAGNSTTGAIASATYFPTNKIGLNLVFGAQYGAELEIQPFGRNIFEDLNFGLSVGLLAEGQLVKSGIKSPAINLGTTAGYNLIKSVGLVLAYRFTPIEKSTRTSSTISAGLQLFL